MAEIGLLVKAGFVETEAVYDVDYGLSGVLDPVLFPTFGRRVAANIEVLAPDGDSFAVGLVDNAVKLLEVVDVGDYLVAGDEVLVLGLDGAQEYRMLTGGRTL
jgi:hypothetical protein